jgi:hypothetical protein
MSTHTIELHPVNRRACKQRRRKRAIKILVIVPFSLFVLFKRKVTVRAITTHD